MRTTTKIVTGGAAALALSGLVGVGLATADPTTSPSPTPGATATPAPDAKADRQQQREGKQGKRDLARRALHGEVTLGGKKSRVVAFQRGAVTKISATSVTVKSTDGFTASYALAGDTKLRKAKQEVALSEIVVGDRVRVVARKDGSAITAQRVAELRQR